MLKRQLSGINDQTGVWSNSDDTTELEKLPSVLMIGTGEYTTGYVDGSSSKSDKTFGVVGITMFDLRRRGVIGNIGLCGVNGNKFPGIRRHFRDVIEKEYKDLDTTVETFPNDDEVDPLSYKKVLDMGVYDIAIIFTPDDTHFEIAKECVMKGMHVLVTKPIVKTLSDHQMLANLSRQYNTLVGVEVHKRWDPIYVDARDRIIRNLGSFSYIYSFMSQPKLQLDTFKAWAGKSSDISYYLNSHHIDFHEWCVGKNARPTVVTAVASSGVAEDVLKRQCEDTITLTVQWEVGNQDNKDRCMLGTAVYTASWVAPSGSDVHSQQRFFYMGQKGEVTVDQAHRGYTMTLDTPGGGVYRSLNPLFMKYTPDQHGRFSGQRGYGYRSLEDFVLAATSVLRKQCSVASFDEDADDEEDILSLAAFQSAPSRPKVATIHNVFRTTAVLEAGRISLDKSRSVVIQYESDTLGSCGWHVPKGYLER